MGLALEFMKFIEEQPNQSVDMLLDKILLKCRLLIGAEAGTIYLVEETDEGEQQIRPVSLQNDAVDMSSVPLTLGIDENSVAGYVAAKGEVVLVDDLDEPEASLPFRFNHLIDRLSGYRSVSMMAFPLRTYSENVIGVVQLINRRVPDKDRPVPFSSDHAALIEPFNQFVGRAIQRTVLLDQLRARNARLQEEVSAREQTEEALRVALSTAEVANRAKSEFLANISHELRTPLTSIIGFAQIMEKETAGSKDLARFAQYATHIHEGGEHLLSLISDILDLSKIEAGEIALDEQNIDVTGSVQASLDLMKGWIGEDMLDVSVELQNELPALRADGRALKQILINLLSNAVKFTPHGGRIVVGAEVDSDGELVMSVTDSGRGIAAEDMDKVMEPFGQAEPAYVRRHQGVGLGLPMVKSLVELHGGKLEIDSEVGTGTRVTVRMPSSRVVQAA